MASLVENIWRMKVDEERPPREDRPLEQNAEKLCGLRLGKLHYYCMDDQQILCVMCRESQEHRHHAAVLLEKAAQPFRVRILLDPGFLLIAKKVLLRCLRDKGKILNHLKILKGDRDRIEKFQSTGEDELEALLTKFRNHRQDTMSVFEQGRQFLREREQCLLELLEGIEQELAEGRNSYVTKGSEEVLRLGALISELEKKAQQPAIELLQTGGHRNSGKDQGVVREGFEEEEVLNVGLEKNAKIWISRKEELTMTLTLTAFNHTHVSCRSFEQRIKGKNVILHSRYPGMCRTVGI
ncbi:hypothetical protein PANDA_022360 [Ailuropoda melanoleuca]|uniref:B box-type domain-containing protein n=1 Tax=Ailuropoda melanoleuca TaxID=9646 RepID=D2I8F6_AILME|nr:hypothetical protein PANDA_022360 [Ailuropoda melanoleuca]